MSILNLPNWTVISQDESEHDYRLTVQYEVDNRVCPHCLSVDVYRWSKIAQLYMDLPIHAKRVGLRVERQRYRCKNCGKTFMQALPDIDEKRAVTKRLLTYIQQESLRRTFTSIAEDVGLTEKTIRNIFREHVATLAKTVIFATPEWLGIDEIHLLKKPRCIVTNVKERTIVDLLPNRNKVSVVNYLSRLKDRPTIQIVTMDMWQPYREAVNQILPQAQIIVDKYHIVRMANQCLETVRKTIRASLTDRQRRTLMHDRFILLRRRFELNTSDQMILETWITAFPQLGQAYRLKEGFCDIWQAQSHSEARTRYVTWKASIPPDLEPAFRPLTLAMANWNTEVFAYFSHNGVTNAYTEALNGLAKLTNKIGRGYSFDAIRAKLLYGTGLHKQRRPPYQKQWPVTPPTDLIRHGLPVDEEQEVSFGSDLSTLIEQLSDEVGDVRPTTESE